MAGDAKKFWTVERVLENMKVMEDVVSLNKEIFNGEGDSVELGDLIEDKESILEESLYKQDTREYLLSIMHKCLSPREEYVMKARFGFSEDEAMTLEAIGQSNNVSRERIRQIEAKALMKLKKYFKRNHIERSDL